ncbi:S66 family peptidase [Chordicoccus furentiruminis]|uniref:S66 family peptidase n=1 Tax=Chordicoccus furentiruminis TaxID=2709410 RepID=UPI0023A8F036|nr:S66 peptidase family protein [Chordicoccus furentiruminis]
MRTPAFLRPGDLIGLCAPSFGAATEPYITRLRSAIGKFEARGYRLRIAPSTYRSDGLGISTKPEDAAADLMNLYLDPEVKAVISVGGGELMNEVLPHLDFETIRKAPPKWFMGYSDNTNFLHPLLTLADVPGIYGPTATGFGKPWEAPERDAFALLEGTDLTVRGYDRFETPWTEDGGETEDPLAPYRLDAKKTLRLWMPGWEGAREAAGSRLSMDGVLIGGCLDVLVNLSGTPFDGTAAFAEANGPLIWVLEACDLSVMSIRRALWHLDELGWFRGAAGFLIGRPLAAFHQEMMGVDTGNAVTDILKGRNVPIVLDVDVGHVKPSMPLIFGSRAHVTVEGDRIEAAMTAER